MFYFQHQASTSKIRFIFQPFLVRIIAFMLLLCAFGNLEAQIVKENSAKPRFPYLNGQMAIVAGYSSTQIIHMPPFQVFEGIVRGGNIGVLYGVNHWLECGVCVDFTYCDRLKIQYLEAEFPVWRYQNVYQAYIGQQVKAHLFPMIRESFYLIDAYLIGTLGGAYVHVPHWEPCFRFLAQVGAGFALNPTRHWGFFVESGYNNRKPRPSSPVLTSALEGQRNGKNK